MTQIHPVMETNMNDLQSHWHVTNDHEILNSYGCEKNLQATSILGVDRKIAEINLLKRILGMADDDVGCCTRCCYCVESYSFFFCCMCWPVTLCCQKWKYDLYHEYARRNNLPVQSYNYCVNDLYIVMANDHYRLTQQNANPFRVPMIPYYALNPLELRHFAFPMNFANVYNDIRRENGDVQDMTVEQLNSWQLKLIFATVCSVYCPCFCLPKLCEWKKEKDEYFEQNLYLRYIEKHNIGDDWDRHPEGFCCSDGYCTPDLAFLYTYRIRNDMISRGLPVVNIMDVQGIRQQRLQQQGQWQ